MRLKITLLILLSLVFPLNSRAVVHSPQAILIGAQFNGAKLHVSDKIANDENVIVQILGSDQESHFKLKGKVGGIFWMTVAHLTFKHAPNLYMIYAPSSLASYINKLNLGYNAVFSKIEIEPSANDKNKVLNDFLKLKEKEGLYKINTNGISYEQKGEYKKFNADIALPPKIAPGTYEIVVYKLDKNNEIKGVERDTFNVELTGFPKFISKMAYNHSLLYGTLAVIIAILAGFIMGFLFKGGGAH